MLSWKDKIRFLLTHRFTWEVSVLQIGTVVNTGLAFLTSLIFARLLGPEQYGFYALVFALAGIINIFQEFGVGHGTVNLLAKAYARKDREEAAKILAAFTKVSILATFTFGLLGVIAAPFIGKYVYQNLYLGKLASIVVATTAFTFFFPLLTITLQVTRRIRTLTLIEVVHKIFYSGLPVILLLVGLGVLGIVTGQFIAMLVMSTVGVWLYVKLRQTEDSLPKLKEFFWRKVSREELKIFFRFGFTIAINKNLVMMATTIPLLILGYFLATDSGIGYYKIAFGYMALPVTLLGPVSRLLNIQFSFTELGGRLKLLRRFFQVSFLSLATTLAIVVPLVLLGPFLVRFFFGVDYEPSIRMIHPLALYPIFVSVGVGLGPLFRTLNKMKVAIYINTLSVLLMIPTAFFLIQSFAIKGLILTVLIFSLLPNVLSFSYFYSMYLKEKYGREGI